MLPFKLYKTREIAAPQKVELITTLLPTKGSPYRLTPVIKLPIGELKAGDVIDINSACCQVSGTITYNMMVGSHLILCDGEKISAGISQNEWGRWVEINEAMTTNFNTNIRHLPVRRTGRYIVTEDWANANLVFLVYASSDAWNGSTRLTVDQDFGRLEGTIQREVTRAELWEFLGAVPEPVPDPDPPEGMINLSITQAQGAAIKEVAALIPAP